MTESIVVSLELAKKMKEVGWPQKESMFYWTNGNPDWAEASYYVDNYSQFLIIDADRARIKLDEHDYAAQTAEEVLRRLPKQLSDGSFLTISPEDDGWAVYYETSNNLPVRTCKAKTLVDACVKMYIYLAENNLLPPQS